MLPFLFLGVRFMPTFPKNPPFFLLSDTTLRSPSSSANVFVLPNTPNLSSSSSNSAIVARWLSLKVIGKFEPPSVPFKSDKDGSDAGDSRGEGDSARPPLGAFTWRHGSCQGFGRTRDCIGHFVDRTLS